MPPPTNNPTPDDRRFAAALAADERYGLALAFPQLAALRRQASLSGTTGVRARAWYADRVERYLAQLTAFPFPPAPREQVNGPVTIGVQRYDGIPVGILPVELCGNLAAIGATGVGKTSFVEHVLTQLDQVSPSTQQCFYDPKKDYRARAARKGCIIVSDDLPLNLLVPPRFLTRELYHALLVRKFCEAYFGGYHMHRILTAAIKEAFVTFPNGPSIAHLVPIIERLGGRQQTYQFQDSKLNTITRLADLCTLFPGIAQATPPYCLTLADLCTRPVYFSSTGMLNAYEFVFSLWVTIRHEYHQYRGIRDELHTMIVADEGLQIFQATTQHITNEPLLTHTIGMTREAGLGFALTLSSIKTASPVLRANLNLQAILRVTDGVESDEIRRTLRLTPPQHEYLDHRLGRGEVLLRLGHRYAAPILASYPPPSPDAKTITTAEWMSAKARSLDSIPKNISPIVVAPPPAPTATAPAPVQRVIALNDAALALLRFIATQGITTVSDAYAAIGAHYQTGDDAKNNLIELGLITATPIIVRKGRGGRAVALRVTLAGTERADVTPPKRTRGGDSAQHEYLVTHLSRLIPGSVLEMVIGTKAVDIFVRVDGAQHEALLIALNEHGHAFATRPPIAPNDVIAIEIEVSDPLTTNNLAKDDAAGLDVIIVAVMPKDYDRVIAKLPTLVHHDLLQRLIVIDSLALLDDLRRTRKEPSAS